ncbi:NAD-dependent dehydratase [Lactobacillus sp. CBA3605]|uniref:SDR family oxidoreductase n=1 Tax=Lactobacillus sp. CBA3605 TaxID=2099788 RepID=UPI000CFB4453|nr:SDR family oxidoreductase [Lactobacillus sp. CBA3605]AVK61186.1 NAD-dependent dehydratase [Lactobacillus sp. CBA3605]
MTKILIIGAYGKTAQLAIKRLLAETNHELVLFLRNAARLNQYQDNSRVTLIDGDVLDTAALENAMIGVDLVYSNVGGRNLADQTASILAAMTATKQQRLIFINSLGVYHEVPGAFGAWNETMIADFLPGFRKAAALIEASPLAYTMLRPAWLSDKPAIDYELTDKGTAFKGTEVSRASVADFILKLIATPNTYLRASVGLNQPNTDGDQPAWFN